MNTKPLAALVIAALLVASGVVVYLMTKEPPMPRPEIEGKNPIADKDKPKVDEAKAKPKPMNKEVEALLVEAYGLQKDRKWCEAEKQWAAVLDAIKKAGEPAELMPVLREAEGNRELLRALCKPAQPLVKELKPEPLPEVDRPPRIDKANFLKFYPQGHQLRHLATLRIKGQGMNADWGVKKEKHFSYWNQVAAQTKVLANDGAIAKFEVNFAKVDQTLVHSSVSVQLDLPEGNVAAIVWDAIGNQVARGVPYVKVVKTAAEIALILDPELRNTLTTLHNRLEAFGLIRDEQKEIIAKVSRLHGHTIRLTYADGIGVTFVEVVGDALAPDLLQNLADNAAPLLDYHVFPAAEKKIGEKWKVRARDVAGLFALGQDAVCAGAVGIQRQPDHVADKTAKLKMEAGELTVTGRRANANERAKVFVESGVIFFELDHLHVSSAKINLKAETVFRSQDHLLFRAEQLRNVEMQSTYQADLVK